MPKKKKTQDFNFFADSAFLFKIFVKFEKFFGKI